jgi:hypothetical protein
MQSLRRWATAGVSLREPAIHERLNVANGYAQRREGLRDPPYQGGQSALGSVQFCAEPLRDNASPGQRVLEGAAP